MKILTTRRKGKQKILVIKTPGDHKIMIFSRAAHSKPQLMIHLVIPEILLNWQH